MNSLWQMRAASIILNRMLQHDEHVVRFRWHQHMLSIGYTEYLDDIAKRRKVGRYSEEQGNSSSGNGDL